MNENEYFYGLTPEKIMKTLEDEGYVCTGRNFVLNSMENRVYELEIEVEEENVRSPSDRFVIAKFYRPGRWTIDQIQEEHGFLLDLENNELPVVAPLKFQDGSTLKTIPESGIHYSFYRKFSGRTPDEPTEKQVIRLGSTLARIHNVGSRRKAEHRLKITPETYGLKNLEYLCENGIIPAQIRDQYRDMVEKICEISAPWFEKAACQRIHGDCHHGNIINRNDEFYFLDFDDMLMGPKVQDIWLLVPGRDAYALELRSALVKSYSVLSDFDERELRLIEPLRALRYIHFSAWISRRWEDPAFPRAFPYFGTGKYWFEQLNDLREQFQIISEISLKERAYGNC